MTLALPFRRLHLFEIADQLWFPPTFRRYVQDVLTEIWTSQTELIQLETPASFVVRTLREVLQSKLHLYLFVDLCSGAGGPTPYIESEINGALIQGTCDLDGSHTSKQDADSMHKEQEDQGVEFILTDLHPYNLAWQNASKASKSGNLRYIPVPVDASLLTKEALGSAVPPRHATSSKEAMVFRLFSLAFHQFDDELATKILDDTLQTSKGFAIFELQGRDVGNIFNVLTLFPVLYLGSWFWYWGEWSLFFWNAIIPVVPFVVVFDGVISCLRTRTEKEIRDLLERAALNTDDGLSGWNFKAGREKLTRLGGTMTYFVGIKE